jgi:hypothetical protein
MDLFFQWLYARIPTLEVRYPLDADVRWIFETVVSVDRARKHTSKFVETAKNHLARDKLAIKERERFHESVRGLSGEQAARAAFEAAGA